MTSAKKRPVASGPGKDNKSRISLYTNRRLLSSENPAHISEVLPAVLWRLTRASLRNLRPAERRRFLQWLEAAQ